MQLMDSIICTGMLSTSLCTLVGGSAKTLVDQDVLGQVVTLVQQHKRFVFVPYLHCGVCYISETQCFYLIFIVSIRKRPK